MDVDHFSEYLHKAPVLYLEGRQHPVEVFHALTEQTDYLFSSLVTVFQIHKTAPISDDILLFLTGQEEIDSTVKSITDLNKSSKNTLPMVVLPLYASLPSGKQLKVFEKAPEGHRKVMIKWRCAQKNKMSFKCVFLIFW
jgi:ATP-dependent RNA helicase DHX33